jgi:hypothetical protein
VSVSVSVTALRPRELAYRGAVEAAGLAFDEDLLGEREVRRRILAEWEPGARLLRLGQQWLLVWSTARLVHCGSCAGAAIVRTGSVLATTPLREGELRALTAQEETFVCTRGGAVETTALRLCAVEDPSEWLDTSAWTLTIPASLGEARQARMAEPVVEGDARAVLRDVPPPAPERNELLALLEKTDAGARRRRSARRAAFTARLVAVLGALAAWLQTSPAGTRLGSGARSNARARPSAAQRARAWLLRVAQRVLTALRLSSLVDARQGRYLRRVLDLFENDDLDAALRHAIPIDGRLDGDSALAPALTNPIPRGDLTIRPQETRAGAVLRVGGELQALLRRTYRRAHERLAAAGRIQEGAFVLTELLHANEEAVSFLETHGRLRLAAELAEARGLAPGLVVRQWFVAGETARAVAFARRTGAFADAVQRLERDRSRSTQAAALRVLWAETLARAGAYGSAVDAAWPVAEARPLTRAWMDAAIEAGGSEGARMLVRLATLDPDAATLVRENALEVLDDLHPAASATRGMLAGAISGARPATPILQVLARHAVRSLLAAPLQSRHLTGQLIERLLETARDGALSADMPSLPEDTGPLPLVVRSSPLCISVPR